MTALDRARRLGWEALLPVALVLGYQLWAGHGDNPYYPTLAAIGRAFRENWTGAGFTENVLPSLWNLARGYLGGVVLGIAGGVLLGRVRVLRRAVSPLISFFLALPPVALLPLFLIVVGVGAQMQVGVILFSVLVYVLVSTADGVRDLDPTLDELSRVYGIRGPRRLGVVLLPAAAPQIIAAARVALSLGVLVMVVSEMVGASQGIGAVTLLAQQSFAYDQMWAGMLLVALLGVVLNTLFGAVERTVVARAGLTLAVLSSEGAR
jgi:ABC-type nitrate/sulfonate/bicarbonate transport system permease component